jgi:hypothetical protein
MAATIRFGSGVMLRSNPRSYTDAGEDGYAAIRQIQAWAATWNLWLGSLTLHGATDRTLPSG